MNKKLLAISLFFLLTLTLARFGYAVLVHYRDVEGTFTVNRHYDLKITWANGTENPRFDLGDVWIGESRDVPSINVTMLGDGAYVRWVYVGPPEMYVSCYQVNQKGNVFFTHGYTVTYTFNFWLKNPLETGNYTFAIRFEVNDVIVLD